jgi:hypothetical protein
VWSGRGGLPRRLVHDDAHGRIKQVTSSGTTLYVNGLGLKVERVEGSGGSIVWNNYVQAAGGMAAVFYERIAGAGTSKTHYFHKDHLGSIGVITDELGAVVQRLAYDAWGKRRNADGTDEPLAQSIPSQLDQNAPASRGFTGHEHLQELALVHMNGRIYDPLPNGANGAASCRPTRISRTRSTASRSTATATCSTTRSPTPTPAGTSASARYSRASSRPSPIWSPTRWRWPPWRSRSRCRSLRQG